MQLRDTSEQSAIPAQGKGREASAEGDLADNPRILLKGDPTQAERRAASGVMPCAAASSSWLWQRRWPAPAPALRLDQSPRPLAQRPLPRRTTWSMLRFRTGLHTVA